MNTKSKKGLEYKNGYEDATNARPPNKEEGEYFEGYKAGFVEMMKKSIQTEFQKLSLGVKVLP
jgi:hypothetical protein